MIGLLALSMAGFLFFVRAETAGIVANSDGQQARLAAESGFEELIAMLRPDRHNVALWYDNPDRFHHALVWGDGFKRDGDPLKQFRTRREMYDRGDPIKSAWRYSIVAERLDGPEDTIRYGVMPEAGKLNLNTASEQQITMLFTPILSGLGIQNPQEIIDAVLDWRDADSTARPNGAENEYYQLQTPAYNCKNGRFDTVEELLLVKGVTAAVLYGEDVNRNGILDANEDDGDASFPEYDDGDGRLNRGIAPYLTVYSREVDTALDNKPRINLNADGGAIRKQIDDQFKNGELSEATIALLTNLQGAGITPSLLKSPADLFPPGQDEEYESPEAAQPADDQKSEGDGAKDGQSETGELSVDGGKQPDSSDDNNSGGGKQPTSRGAPSSSGDQPKAPSGVRPATTTPKTGKAGGAEKAQDTGSKGGKGNDTGGKGGGDVVVPPPSGGRGGKGGTGTGGKGPSNGAADTGGKTPGDPSGGGKSPQGQNPGGGRRGGAGGPGGQAGGGVTPEAMFNALKNSPVTLQELPFIMDRFSTRPPQQATGLIEGVININAAPYLVLLTVPGMTPDAATKIVGMRAGLDAATLSTTAWPLISGALEPASWKKIAPNVTTKAYQFHVEIVGYADHIKTARRYEWIVEMVGPMPQVKYFRDLTSLGFAWPVDSETQVVTK